MSQHPIFGVLHCGANGHRLVVLGGGVGRAVFTALQGETFWFFFFVLVRLVTEPPEVPV